MTILGWKTPGERRRERQAIEAAAALVVGIVVLGRAVKVELDAAKKEAERPYKSTHSASRAAWKAVRG